MKKPTREEGQDDSEEEEEENDEEKSKSDKVKLLPASHYIGDKYLWEMTEKSDPRIADKENDKVYVPMTSKLDIESKLGQDQQPRFLEDEGMYIGTTPNVAKSKNQNKMEHRLLREQNQGHSSSWFGSDGKLSTLPNPLRKKPTRPSNVLDDDMLDDKLIEPLTYFCPPALPGPDGLPMQITSSGKQHLWKGKKTRQRPLYHFYRQVDQY